MITDGCVGEKVGARIECGRTKGVVEATCLVNSKRPNTECIVLTASGALTKRSLTDSGVAIAIDVAQECRRTDGSVVEAFRVGKKRECSISRVGEASSVTKKRTGANGSVVFGGVAKERPRTDSCAEAAIGETQKRIYTDSGIVSTADKASKSETPTEGQRPRPAIPATAAKSPDKRTLHLVRETPHKSKDTCCSSHRFRSIRCALANRQKYAIRDMRRNGPGTFGPRAIPTLQTGSCSNRVKAVRC